MLAEKGVGSGGGAGNPGAAMDQHIRFGGNLSGKVENAFHVAKAGRIGKVWIIHVLEKTKEQRRARRDGLDPFATFHVIKKSFVPNRNDVRPGLAFLVRQLADAAYGEVDFHK